MTLATPLSLIRSAKRSRRNIGTHKAGVMHGPHMLVGPRGNGPPWIYWDVRCGNCGQIHAIKQSSIWNLDDAKGCAKCRHATESPAP